MIAFTATAQNTFFLLAPFTDYLPKLCTFTIEWGVAWALTFCFRFPFYFSRQIFYYYNLTFIVTPTKIVKLLTIFDAKFIKNFDKQLQTNIPNIYCGIFKFNLLYISLRFIIMEVGCSILNIIDQTTKKHPLRQLVIKLLLRAI